MEVSFKRWKITQRMIYVLRSQNRATWRRLGWNGIHTHLPHAQSRKHQQRGALKLTGILPSLEDYLVTRRWAWDGIRTRRSLNGQLQGAIEWAQSPSYTHTWKYDCMANISRSSLWQLWELGILPTLLFFPFCNIPRSIRNLPFFTCFQQLDRSACRPFWVFDCRVILVTFHWAISWDVSLDTPG